MTKPVFARIAAGLQEIQQMIETAPDDHAMFQQRQTVPLSKAAVEAAARELLVVNGYDDQPAPLRLKEYKLYAADILRAALAAWEPSDAQAQALRNDLDYTEFSGPDWSTLPRGIAAAVRTEADE